MARTFKDDVLALYHGENKKGSLTYFSIRLLNNWKIEATKQILSCDKKNNSIDINTVFFSEGLHITPDIKVFSLVSPQKRRKISDYLFRNCWRENRGNISNILISHNSKVYFPYSSKNIKFLRDNIRSFNASISTFTKRASIKFTSHQLSMITEVYAQWLFHCTFFNKYSDMGILDKRLPELRKDIFYLGEKNMIANINKFKEMSSEDMHNHFLKNDLSLLIEI